MILSIDVNETKGIIIKPGQKVDFDTPLKESKHKVEKKIYIAQILNIAPQKIFSYLKKFVGENIKAGEVIAEKKSLFSFKKYNSQYDGVIKEINHQEGFLLIDSRMDVKEMKNAYFKGEVVAIEPNRIKLKVGSYKGFELKESVNDFGGETLSIDSSRLSSKNLILAYLSEETLTNKIVIAESLSSYIQIKIETLGAKGFITLHHLPEKTNLPYAKLKNINDWQIINNLNYPYCIINKKNNKIYFYS